MGTKLKGEVKHSFEMMALFFQTTWHHIPEAGDLKISVMI
jgi:hypothetical protein